MRKRKYSLHVMLDEKEWENLRLLEEYTGLKRSVIMRKMICGVEIKQRPDPGFREVRVAVDYIGNNINMICHHANVCRLIDNEDLRLTREYMAEVRDILRDLSTIYDRH